MPTNVQSKWIAAAQTNVAIILKIQKYVIHFPNVAKCLFNSQVCRCAICNAHWTFPDIRDIKVFKIRNLFPCTQESKKKL